MQRWNSRNRQGVTNLGPYRSVLSRALRPCGVAVLGLVSVICGVAVEPQVRAGHYQGEMSLSPKRVGVLPSGSNIGFVLVSPWALYGRWIAAGVVFIFLAITFIGNFLPERRRRRAAEVLLGYELRFASFIAALSAKFANIPTEQINTEIANTLEKLRELLEFDRISLYMFSQDDGQFVLAGVASLEGSSSGPERFGRKEFPWLVSNLAKGRNCVIRHVNGVPIHAETEQILLGPLKYTFAAFVPLRAAGQPLGSIGFTSFREGMQPDKVLQQLRVAGEIFANALVRKQFEAGLGESQRRFQHMADAAPVMIWMSGTDKLCNFFNKQWLEFTGRTLHQELGSGWTEGVHPEDLSQCLKTYFSSFDARLRFTMEYRLRRADGEYGWVFDTGVPRYSPAGEFMGYIGSCTDITDRRQAEQGILDLSGRLIFAQEEERCRIARELHDDFSQRLALLAIQLGQVSESLPYADRATSERLHLMWEKTTELSADIHRLSHQLHSSKLHHLGLLAAAKSLCEETGRQHGIQIEFSERQVPEDVPPDIGLCFFRIIQEALNNMVKHSGARVAHLEFIGNSSHMRLRIVDAGIGFDPSSRAVRGGLGLASMRERLRVLGGSISVRSRPMEGTEIVAEVPLGPTDLQRQFPQTILQRAVGGES
jgi:PAS domain S-box-containing protein